MNKSDCVKQKLSNRAMGLIVLLLGAGLSLVGGVIVPVAGFLFGVPIFILAATLIIAPESKVCRLIFKRDS